MVAVVLLAAVLLLTGGVSMPQAKAQGPGNAILIQDMGKAGDLPDRRPFQISRIFAQGEMPACAQASVDGVPIETQCNVKGRWRDGSLKHAILTFWADLPAKGYMQVDFIPSECRDDGSGMSREEILNYLDGKWGAVIEAKANVAGTTGSSALANVRTMLEQWDGQASDSGIRYWIRGRLATQLIVEDRSPATKYDFGWKTDWPMLKSGANVTATSEAIKVQATSVPLLAAWTFPVTAYFEAERIRVCSASGDTLTVCPGGRGVDGTTAATHLANRGIGANAGWTPAAEDRYRSLHPIFVVTIYPGWNGVKVDAILENVWSTRLQDQVYFARVGRGVDGSETLWTKDVVHVAQTRWRKTFWNGSALPETRIDHNFPYLVYTGAVPSYDLELKINPSAIRAEQDNFSKSDRGEVNGFGVWERAMPSAGGRGDIGLVPRWYLMYLYTGDHTLQKAMFANADVSGQVPIHIRESLEDPRAYVEGRDALAAGRPLSIDARPTTYARNFDFTENVRKADQVVPVGPISQGMWNPDMAHHPAMVYVPYLLSGDWYYMEEQQFWAAYSLTWVSPGNCPWCRGNSLGYIYGSTEPRAEAWSLRTLAEAAFVSEDFSPEKDYFEKKLQNNIATREGKLDVRGGTYYDPLPECKYPCTASPWRYGRDYPGQNIPNPLHFAEIGANGALKDPTINYEVTQSEGSPWQHHFLHVTNGHIRDLGYVEIEPQRKALAGNLIGQILDPGYNPYLAAEYRMPLMGKDTKQFFTRWSDVLNGFNEPYKSEQAFPAARLSLPIHYPYNLLAAASYAADVKTEEGYSGAEAYRWVRNHVKYEVLGQDPTWAMVPRGWSAGGQEAARVIQPKWYRKPERGSKGPKGGGMGINAKLDGGRE